MKRVLAATFVFALGSALSAPSLAQGRHDEKPHGTLPKASQSTQYAPVAVSGGRHDERPHGPRKPLVSKQQKSEASNSAPAADDCCTK
jgi:hypothetical protein